MPLELRFGKNGTVRPYWYGRYEINGKRLCPNLGIAVAGTPPASLSLRDEGDTAFERSRATAQAKLDGIVAEARSKRDAIRLVEKLYEIKTGEEIQRVPIKLVADEWLKIPRKRKLDERYAQQCIAIFQSFSEFVGRKNPAITELGEVTRTLGRAFMQAEAERGVTAKTWNDHLLLLRGTVRRLLPSGAMNPFADIPTRETDIVFRKPFTPEELKLILDAAKEDEFMRPLIVTGICTAMRRGDCCLLRWADVDLAQGFINVKTAKTGQKVGIPIFPLLQDELGKAKEKRNGSEYVFPTQAEQYVRNAVTISKKVRDVFAAAGFRDLAEEECIEVAGEVRQLPAAGNCSDGPEQGVPALPYRGNVSAKRAEGLRRASVRDFHSFRVTWVTLALTARVPLELVTKVTGHKTTEIVLKHYFQPGREAFRQALQSAMPKLLTNGVLADGHVLADSHRSDGHRSPKEELREIVAGMTIETLQRDRERLLEVLERF